MLALLAPITWAQEPAWTPLFTKEMSAFRQPVSMDWIQVADVSLDEANPKKLAAKPGEGAWYNGPKGSTKDLFTKDKFGDVELHMEFALGKGSNSGVKFHGHYEIQFKDSFGSTKELTGDDCGGIYPRAEMKPRYHHIDKGIAPKINACKEPGTWQTLDVTFLAPRFGKDGKKIANAKLVKVLLNDKVIHDNVELQWPTGHNWVNPEFAEGPIMIQGDHGPVAFRNVKIRPVTK